MKELKPCPFCGGKAKLLMKKDNFRDYFISARCEKCGARIGGHYPNLKLEDEAVLNIINCADDAINDWNRRAK